MRLDYDIEKQRLETSPTRPSWAAGAVTIWDGTYRVQWARDEARLVELSGNARQFGHSLAVVRTFRLEVAYANA